MSSTARPLGIMKAARKRRPTTLVHSGTALLATRPPDEWLRTRACLPCSARLPRTARTAATSSARLAKGVTVPPTVGSATWMASYPAFWRRSTKPSHETGFCQEPGTMTMVGLDIFLNMDMDR